MKKKEKQTTLEGGKLEEGVEPTWTATPPGAFPGFRVYRNYRDARGKSIGLVIGKEGHRYFWKSVDRKKHFHRNHRSWAIASSLVEELHREKVDGIILNVQDEKVYYVTLEDFDKHSIIDQFPPYEEQNFLHENYWKPWDEVSV